MKKNEIINDMRGESYSSNYMSIENDNLYYCGMSVKYIWKSKDNASDYFYDIIVMNDVIAGKIALTENDLKKAENIIYKYKSEPHSLNPHPERYDDGY